MPPADPPDPGPADTREPAPTRARASRAGGRRRTRTLTVAVTGPTGEIGQPLLRALEGVDEVGRVLGMARRPFDPTRRGWRKVEFRQGDILDREAVDALVRDADVVVHLAFVIFGSLAETRETNLQGSRNVFEAAAAAGVERLVYTSSVAAYGWHRDNPDWLTEDVEPRGTDAHYYSAQKAELERVLAESLRGSSTRTYVFRPCIVAGPEAPALIEKIPWVQLSERLPEGLRRVAWSVPGLRPVLPDPGVPFQLVHHDDVASALVAAILGRGEPGVYNLAGPGEMRIADLASELGWYSAPVPEFAVHATAELVARMPFAPAEAHWVNAVRRPVLMRTDRARRQLGWQPAHDVAATLRETVVAARERGTLGS